MSDHDDIDASEAKRRDLTTIRGILNAIAVGTIAKTRRRIFLDKPPREERERMERALRWAQKVANCTEEE